MVCDNCNKNITLLTYVVCDENDYCVKCFANLEEYPETYSISNTLNYSLTEPDWLCIDDILLLTAYQKWGFGNWDEITDFMNFNGCRFTKIELE